MSAIFQQAVNPIDIESTPFPSMPFTAAIAICSLAAYFVGSLPFGFLTAKTVAGIDIRHQGSGNIGATNVARVIGTKWGVVVLCLDCLKGLLPVLLLPPVVYGDPLMPGFGHLQVACGIATIVGHMFPIWLRFRGGKGVATALGVAIMLGPIASAAALAVFAIMLAVFRFVSLGSMTAAVTFGVVQIVLLQSGPLPMSETWSRGAFSLLVPLLIIARHRSNLIRLVRGEESRFELKHQEESTNDAIPNEESR